MSIIGKVIFDLDDATIGSIYDKARNWHEGKLREINFNRRKPTLKIEYEKFYGPK